MKKIIHKISLITIISMLAAISVPLSAQADGGGGGLTKEVDGYHLQLSFEKPLAKGENHVILHIQDEQGAPVANAHVEASIMAVESDHAESDNPGEESSAHESAEEETEESHNENASSESGHSEEPQSESSNSEGSETHSESSSTSNEHSEIDMVVLSPGHEAGEYSGTVDIPSTGEWQMQLHLTIEGHAFEIDFPLNIPGSVSGSRILVGFLMINVAIVGSAAVTKNRKFKTSLEV